MDGIFGNGSRQAASLESRVIIIGTTSLPDQLDPAITRPGRLDTIINIPMPGTQARKGAVIVVNFLPCEFHIYFPSLILLEIFALKLKRLPLPDTVATGEAFDTFLEELASSTSGYSGAEIENLCREAAMRALRANIHSTILEPRFLRELAVPRVTLS